MTLEQLHAPGLFLGSATLAAAAVASLVVLWLARSRRRSTLGAPVSSIMSGAAKGRGPLGDASARGAAVGVSGGGAARKAGAGGGGDGRGGSKGAGAAGGGGGGGGAAAAAAGNADDDPDTAAVVSALLQHCRDGLAGGNRDQALAALLHAVRLSQGEEAIAPFLDAAKARAQREAESQARIEAAERRLEAESLRAAERMSAELAADESALLSQRGKSNILQEAFDNGSSVVCGECHSLVPRARFAQHRDFWCEAREGGDDDDDADDDSDSD